MAPSTSRQLDADLSPARKTTLDDRPVDRKVVLSGLWVAVLLLYAYVDMFGFFRADIVDGALKGRVPGVGLEINQQFLLGATLYILVPSLMVAASLLLPARANRVANLVVSVAYALSVIVLTIGEPWLYYVVGSIAETVLLVTIAVLAWRWPTVPR